MSCNSNWAIRETHAMTLFRRVCVNFGAFFQILASDKTGDFGVKLYLPKNTYNGIVELSAKHMKNIH